MRPVCSARRFLSRAGRVLAAAILALAGVVPLGAAEWRCGFEPAEGFVAGAPPQHARVSVLGGTAEVLAGVAAEGAQFLRFVPVDESNALVLELPAEMSGGGGERTISFAIRLIGEPDTTRLVLSYRETIALSWAGDGVEIEVAGGTRERVRVAADRGVSPWIVLTVGENSAGGEWSMAVNGVPAFRRRDAALMSSELTELLIFADGSLDLDAVRVALTSAAGAEVARGNLDGTAGASAAEQPGRREAGGGPPDRARWQAVQAEALKRAKRGELGAAEALVVSLLHGAGVSAEDRAQAGGVLAYLAFVLRQEGKGRAAVALGRAALRQIELAQRGLDAGAERMLEARLSFLCGQIHETVLIDRTAAQRQYDRTLELNAGHVGARQRTEALVRQSESEARRFNVRDGRNP